MVDWIIENKAWLFSGVGIAVISGILWLLRRIVRKIRVGPAGSRSGDCGDGSGCRPEVLEASVNQEDRKRGNRLNPSPEEIFEDIESRPPFQRSEAEKHYEGLKVKRWAVALKSVFERQDGKYQIHLGPVDGNGKVVSCLVDIHRYPEVKIVDEQIGLWVSGIIESVHWESGEIALSDAWLEFE